MVDTLSWQATLLVTLVNEVTGFQCLKKLYIKYDNFVHIWDRCMNHQNAEDFLIQDGFLFKVN